MTWEPGRDKIERLLSNGELERVTPDTAVARRLLADATKHLDTAAPGLAATDPSGAYQLAYDAFRKSAVALLAAQGLRATSRGGHIAVQDAITAQFGATVRTFKSFSRIRRADLRIELESPRQFTDDLNGVTIDCIAWVAHFGSELGTLVVGLHSEAQSMRCPMPCGRTPTGADLLREGSITVRQAGGGRPSDDSRPVALGGAASPSGPTDID